MANDAGGTDLALSVATPAQTRHRSSGDVVTALTSYTTINEAWHSTFSQTNVLAGGSARFPRGCTWNSAPVGCPTTSAR